MTEEQRVKQAVRDRDKVCRGCGLTNAQHLWKWGRSLNIHRIKPKSPYTVDGCTLLCKSCHAKIHGGHGAQPDRGKARSDVAIKFAARRAALDERRKE